MAVWLYRIAVRAGNFDIVRSSVSSISNDQRIQGADCLLLQWLHRRRSRLRHPDRYLCCCWYPWVSTPSEASMLALVANASIRGIGAIGIPVTTLKLRLAAWTPHTCRRHGSGTADLRRLRAAADGRNPGRYAASAKSAWSHS